MSPSPAVELPRDLESVATLIAARFEAAAHGNMPGWLDALRTLPDIAVGVVTLGDTVTAEGRATDAERDQLAQCLMALHPWRKGPFRLFGIAIDTEWRSDWKWQRVSPHLASLEGHRVLDVGSGNGYFGWRMLGAGAAEVIGVDPSLLFCLQHQAVSHYLGRHRLQVLPVRFEELPPQAVFDTVFSMGVVYHRRNARAHVAGLHHHTRRGGQVVLESLVVESRQPLVSPGRYARMRNVHIVPTPGLMRRWLEEAGFEDVRLVDVSSTTLQEQRSTAWMRFESLERALDPHDPSLTVEGHPAPVRAVAVGRKPV